MTLSPFMVYLAMQADTISMTLFHMGMGLLLAFLVKLFIIETFCPKFLIPGLILIILHAFTPTTKTVAAMAILPAITNNEQVQQLPADILGFVRGLIREYTPKEGEAKL